MQTVLLQSQHFSIQQFLQKHPLFSSLHSEHIISLLPHIKLQPFRHEEIIYKSTLYDVPKLFFVQKGTVLVSYAPNNTDHVVYTNVLGADDYFVSHRILGNQALTPDLTVQSYYHTFLYVFSQEAIDTLFSIQPNIHHTLKQSLYPHMDSLFYFLFTRSLKTITQKTAAILLYFQQRFSKVQSLDSCTLNIPLSHRLIADFISVSRETVTKAMIQLVKLNLIHYTDHRFIHIPSLKNLKEWMLQ